MPLILTDPEAQRFAELEARAVAGFSLEDALTERDRLVKLFAVLDAVVGPGGTKDDDLSSFWHVLEMEHRLQAEQEGRKVSQALLESLVYSDARYINKLADLFEMRREWVLLKNEIDNWEKRIQWASAMVRFHSSEPKA